MVCGGSRWILRVVWRVQVDIEGGMWRVEVDGNIPNQAMRH